MSKQQSKEPSATIDSEAVSTNSKKSTLQQGKVEIKQSKNDASAKEVLGNVASIETSGFVDGPGVRIVVFLQGCPLRCLYCHNPEDAFFDTQRKLRSPQDVVNIAKRYVPYFGKDGGITFSGGEPLKQAQFLLQTLKLCKQNNINTCIDTSGVAIDILENKKLYEQILNFVDLVILDVKAVEEEEYKALTGREICYFNAFLKLCQKKKKDLWIRQVIVPGINDNEQSILKLKEFISKIKYVKKVELLPYHDMAKDKYKKLKLKYRLEDTPPMDAKKCKKLQRLLLKKD